MKRLNLGLTLLVLLSYAPVAWAQDLPAAMPVTPVVGEALPVPDSTAPVVVELFSSQACIFCPRADRLLADLVTQPNVIALACHVDYFDVKTGALSQPFCTARQTWYQQVMHNGPNYTPQMVMQGGIDVVGYKITEIAAGMKKAAQAPVLPLYVFATDHAGEFRVALSDTVSGIGGSAVLNLAVYDRPHDVAIAEGRNRGQKVTYYNIVSDFRGLGAWPDGQQGTVVAVPLTDAHEGFAVLLQDSATGKIIAAGKFKRELPAPAAIVPSPSLN